VRGCAAPGSAAGAPAAASRAGDRGVSPPEEPFPGAAASGPLGEGADGAGVRAPERAAPPVRRRRGYVGGLGLLILVLIALNAALRGPHGASGVAPGQPMPPFAAPLVLGQMQGDADIAAHADQGAAGRVPACQERGAQILNICELYEQGPVVLAMFVDGGSCPQVLEEMQRLVPAFPQVRFAAVSIGGDRASLRSLVRSQALSFPVGIDRDGAVAGLYKVASCPQVSFAYPGGTVQSAALVSRPTPAALRLRVQQLLDDSRAHTRASRVPA